MNTTPFCGVHTALATPMQDGAVDYASLGRLIDYQIAQGVQGLVPTGTTGESPTLDYDEHIEVIRFTVARAAGRVPVTAGAGSNSTAEQVELVRRAVDAGAPALLLVAPYYNKPSQEGLFRHFAAAAKSTDKPIILYSIPGRCVIEIGIPTVKRLRREFPNIIGLKDSGATTDRITELRRELDPEFVILSGDDSTTLPMMACGADGIISVASNLAVKPIVEMVRLARAGDLKGATKLHLQYYPIFKNIFTEPSPAPIKYALQRAGIIASAEVRAPLCEIGEATRNLLDATLRDLKLI
ncbi:MAG TPA: 4-hydroxy-tetrahydrodipicolinate synthase [Opitutales bacterium]|jgi:4-hydroxy-tetrahydrodipicolinate synthase|nr:4-hydroxy-tetrahydrodipicolinate synthase [Opitutales bacterium]